MDTPEQMDSFDAGELNTHGGGNVGWWIDYIRSLLGSAEDHYQQQHEQALIAERQRAEAAEETVKRLSDELDMREQEDCLNEGDLLKYERERDELTAHIAVLREVLASNGCPACGGDCSAANPPVGAACPMHVLSTTPAASLDALTQRVRAEAMEEAAKIADERSIACDKAAKEYSQQKPDEPYWATSERCAEREATHIGAAIRQRAQEGA